MQTPREISENRTMHGIAVALLSEDREHLSTLQNRVEDTRLGRVVFSHAGFPVSPTDSILRQIQDLRTEVVIVDLPSLDAARAITAIELIRATTLQIATFANRDLTQPSTIVARIRPPASEYPNASPASHPLLAALA